jgi:low molecular weight protein-tyrosine phosphatase
VRDRFDVVFVCTGNRFRSPIAAAVFSAAAAGMPVRIHSVGTLERNDAPVLPEASRLGSSYGLDLSEHRSRNLRELPLADADLVVGFEPIHVTRAVVDGGARPNRSFLLAELVDVLEGCELPDADRGLQRARAAVALAGVRRRARESAAPPIPDPFGGSQQEYERIGARVRDLAGQLAGLLFGRARG